MADFRERIDELAQLMDEFHLAEARLESDGAVVAFRRRTSVPRASEDDHDSEAEHYQPGNLGPTHSGHDETPTGQAVTSPMTGIYYGSPSPNVPDFVKEGDHVHEGQIIGLIEAMKVFNEIPCSLTGTVLKVAIQSGQIVQHGDVLLWIR